MRSGVMAFFVGWERLVCVSFAVIRSVEEAGIPSSGRQNYGKENTHRVPAFICGFIRIAVLATYASSSGEAGYKRGAACCSTDTRDEFRAVRIDKRRVDRSVV